MGVRELASFNRVHHRRLFQIRLTVLVLLTVGGGILVGVTASRSPLPVWPFTSDGTVKFAYGYPCALALVRCEVLESGEMRELDVEFLPLGFACDVFVFLLWMVLLFLLLQSLDIFVERRIARWRLRNHPPQPPSVRLP
jgi:hypothetical protein